MKVSIRVTFGAGRGEESRTPEQVFQEVAAMG
jgi:hypothetical protein